MIASAHAPPNRFSALKLPRKENPARGSIIIEAVSYAGKLRQDTFLRGGGCFFPAVLSFAAGRIRLRAVLRFSGLLREQGNIKIARAEGLSPAGGGPKGDVACFFT